MKSNSPDLVNFTKDIARIDRYMILNRVYENMRDKMCADKNGCLATYLNCIELVNNAMIDILKRGEKCS